MELFAGIPESRRRVDEPVIQKPVLCVGPALATVVCRLRIIQGQDSGSFSFLSCFRKQSLQTGFFFLLYRPPTSPVRSLPHSEQDTGLSLALPAETLKLGDPLTSLTGLTGPDSEP